MNVAELETASALSSRLCDQLNSINIQLLVASHNIVDLARYCHLGVDVEVCSAADEAKLGVDRLILAIKQVSERLEARKDLATRTLA